MIFSALLLLPEALLAGLLCIYPAVRRPANRLLYGIQRFGLSSLARRMLGAAGAGIIAWAGYGLVGTLRG